jgi:hypothetical protein
VPESAHWLIASGHYERADTWMVTQARLNRRPIDLHAAQYDDDVVRKKLPTRTVFDIFRSKVIEVHTLTMYMLFAANLFSRRHLLCEHHHGRARLLGPVVDVDANERRPFRRLFCTGIH